MNRYCSQNEKQIQSNSNKIKQSVLMTGPEKKIIEQLQKYNNIDFIDFVDSEDNNVLHHAAQFNYCLAMEQYLILLRDKKLWRQKEGFKISNETIRYKTKVFINAENKDGVTALHKASMKGNIKIAEQLQDAGARQDKQSHNGYSVLHYAVQENKLNSMLFFRGKINLNACDIDGCTPLHLASQNGNQVIVSYLVNEAQIQLNSKNKQGQTALHIATISQHQKIVKILLLAGANRYTKDKNKKQAIDYANQQINKLLTLKHGCECNKQFVFQPKTKQNCKQIIFIFVLISLLTLQNYLVVKYLIKYNSQQLYLEFHFNQIYFLCQIFFIVISLILALYLHFRKNQIPQFSLHSLIDNLQLCRDFCFMCQTIKKQGIQHCYYCYQCYNEQIKHSHVIGRCIDIKNRYYYLFLILFVNLLLIRLIIRGAALCIYMIHVPDKYTQQFLIKIIVTILNLLCLIPIIRTAYQLYKVIKFLCYSRQKKLSKLSQSPFDSNSRLIIKSNKMEDMLEGSESYNQCLSKKKSKSIQQFSTSDILLQ